MQKDAFLNYLQFEKRYSPLTVRSYKIDLKQFYLYFSLEQEDNDSLKKLTAKDIRSWLLYLMQNIAPVSVNRKLTTIKSFYKYLQRNNIIDQNPVEKIDPPKVSESLPEFINEEPMQKLSGMFEKNEDKLDFGMTRDFLMIELLYNTGIRQAELINLKHGDFDVDQEQIKVLGKRNKERIIPVTEFVTGLYQRYLNFKEDMGFQCNFSDRILLTDKGNKLYPSFVYNKVKEYLGKVSSMKKRSPHTLRHSFATHMLNRGADINAIKELLGHSSLAATQVYTHNSFEQLKSVYNKAHPRADL